MNILVSELNGMVELVALHGSLVILTKHTEVYFISFLCSIGKDL
jgi:hypothetical protein